MSPKLSRVKKLLPSWKSAALSLLAAGLLILAFPDFEFWFLAWFALVPLLWAIDREKESTVRTFLLGWLFGIAFFFGTCWWLTYAPIHYAAVPWPIAYSLIFIACLGAGVFPGVFAAVMSVLLKKFGSRAFLAAPFVWVFSEFLRYWLTGNNWNAIGYSQAFGPFGLPASIGGVLFVSVFPAAFQGAILAEVFARLQNKQGFVEKRLPYLVALATLLFPTYLYVKSQNQPQFSVIRQPLIHAIAIQPNVPMSSLSSEEVRRRRDWQFAKALEIETGLDYRLSPSLIILPESPMNFMYHDDREFQQFIGDFARRNNVSVLFNSAEPDKTNGKYFNSAVMVGPDGREAVQYDKIYLLPFGEAVPPILEGIVPGFVGNFSYGGEYDLFPLGDARAGVMICFESHFGQLSREYVRNGADVLIEMTNDGYLGPTPVLRQHLANAVFRAVETNRPVLRVTNVGITAYINERGQVLGEAPSYTEATRVWSVSKSDGSQTFYVKYGDWFAWLCGIVTFGLLIASLRRRKSEQPAVAGVEGNPSERDNLFGIQR